LPHEQRPNPYISPNLGFEFRYFFMRKFWFAYLARAVLAFPGGFGTLDELTEFLTLSQTKKLSKRLPIFLYGRSFWNDVVNFEAFVRHGVIDREDLSLFQIVDGVDEAFGALLEVLQGVLAEAQPESPAVACSQMSKPIGS
jgi:hypothetical protein